MLIYSILNIFAANLPSMKGAETKRKVYKLMLANDEIHTFEYVIESLVKVCGHGREQAEQCAYLVHLKGICDVKRGSLKELTTMLTALSKLELTAKIEK
jgi:ATP-dependent Clp protease adaptor protein ClpS